MHAVTPLAIATVNTESGDLTVATTERGVCRIDLPNAQSAVAAADVTAAAAESESAEAAADARAEAERLLAEAVSELREYFDGVRTSFSVPLDDRAFRGFHGIVQHAMAEIPYGKTASYKELAQAVGNPAAIRAVGGACASNPVPIILPCHRVVRSDGTLGNYGGGLDMKRALLDLEARGAAGGAA